MTNELPPLPKPTWLMPERMAGKWDIPGAFSSEQMQEYARAAIAQAHKPLTDEQRFTAFARAEKKMMLHGHRIWRDVIADEIEAAHGIKGGEQ